LTTKRATARATARAEADSCAALRNDNQKSNGKGNGKGKERKQIPSLRCGMTAKRAKATAKAKDNTGISPLRQTMGPLGSDRDDGTLSGRSLEMCAR
jgi:hypothetical protein